MSVSSNSFTKLICYEDRISGYMTLMYAELIARLIIELFWMYACVYAVRSTKLVYWRQCWYLILAGCLTHTVYLVIELVSNPAPCTSLLSAGMLRNIGMGLVAIGMLLLAKRMKTIMGSA